MDNNSALFDKAIRQLGDLVPKSDLLFVGNMALKEIGEKEVFISVPSEFVENNVKKHIPTLNNILSELFERELKCIISVDQNQKVKKTKDKKEEKTEAKEKKAESPLKKKNETLNKKYTLSNFIRGDNSNLAYEAAQIISKNPGTSYNPCLIYGGVGLGKTHLLYAIGNAIGDNFPTKTIVYVSSDLFIDEFIETLNDNSAKNRFRNKYRKADVLLIDDIQFLQKKEKTQEELFHIFNDLYENDKQLVFTSDRPISELKDITERLRTRFIRGFNVDLQPPPYEVRIAIARQKCKERNLKLSNEIIEYVCENVKTNVRDLEGMLTTLSGVSEILGKPVTIDLAKEQLRNFINASNTKKLNISIDDIFTVTSNYFNVSLVDIRGNSRSTRVQIPRQVATYLAHSYGKYTFSEIGTYLDKDHTSISYTVNKVEGLISSNESYKKAIKDISLKLDES